MKKWISPLGQLKKCLHMWDLFMWCITWHLPKPFDWFFHYFIFQTRLCINQIHSSCKSRKKYDYVEAILKKNVSRPTFTYIDLMYLLSYPLQHYVFISKFSINVLFYVICASKNFFKGIDHESCLFMEYCFLLDLSPAKPWSIYPEMSTHIHIKNVKVKKQNFYCVWSF